jgi:hypothetical protein
MWGFSDLPERHPSAAPEVDLWFNLHAGDAGPVCVLLGLFPILCALVEDRESVGYQRTMVGASEHYPLSVTFDFA